MEAHPTDGCLSDLELERLLADGVEARVAYEHCQQQLSRKRAQEEAFRRSA